MTLKLEPLTAHNADQRILLAIAATRRELSAEFLALPKWKQVWSPMAHLRETHDKGWVAYAPSVWFPNVTRYGRNAASQAIRRLEDGGLINCDRPHGRTTHVRLTEAGSEAVARLENTDFRSSLLTPA
ncbi:MAG: hypothetical protein O3C60_18460 [Planctomycetota bacterium]|nr:hypothetical protein [Planctomycetota bacterium]